MWSLPLLEHRIHAPRLLIKQTNKQISKNEEAGIAIVIIILIIFK